MRYTEAMLVAAMVAVLVITGSLDKPTKRSTPPLVATGLTLPGVCTVMEDGDTVIYTCTLPPQGPKK